MNPSIFGVEAPKFEVNGNTLLLDHIVITDDIPEHYKIMHESVITRYREFDNLGTHWIFEIDLFLFKFGDEAARQVKYDEIISYKRRLGKLWRRRDGENFKQVDGINDALFRLHKVIPTYFDSPDYEDILKLQFISQDPVLIESTIPEVP